MPTNDVVTPEAIPVEAITDRIVVVRGHRVLLDSDLAALYGVETGRFNEQVRRNAVRFPADFMFQLSADEYAALISQFATSKPGRGGRRHLPYAFTEHGTIMAASVLNSPRAVETSVFIVRAFVRMRDALLAQKDWLARLNEIEATVEVHDSAIRGIFEALRLLKAPSEKGGK